MRAMAMTQCGGREVLHEMEVPTPQPGPGEVRVRVKAVGLNHLDIWIRKGLPHMKMSFPHLLGADVSGVVESLGPGAKGCEIGDSVLLAPATSCGQCHACLRGEDHFCRQYSVLGEHRWGGTGEFVVVPSRNIFPKPSTVTHVEAAALPLIFLTAWTMLVRRANLQRGEWVLIHAGASGVGSAAVQIANYLGANIMVTAGSEEKLKLAQSLGAHHLIPYKKKDFLKEVKRRTQKRGVDVVFEHTGAETWPKSILSLAPGGRLVTCGATTGFDAHTDLRYVFFKKLSLLGSTMGGIHEFQKIFSLVENGVFKPVIHTALPLAQMAEGHRLLEDRQAVGKVIFQV